MGNGAGNADSAFTQSSGADPSMPDDDDRMSPEEYREHLQLAGLNQTTGAKFLCAAPRTSRQWAERGAPGLVGKVLRYVVSTGISPEKFNRIANRDRGDHNDQ